jgi:hypothetical protein
VEHDVLTTPTMMAVVIAWSTVITTVAVTARAATASAAAYAEGAPPGFSSGFEEQSCHACHFHADVNASPGRVALEGVPERYESGRPYSLTIVLSRPAMKVAGFQLAARTDAGTQAGTLAPGPEERDRVGIDTQGGIQYANQRAKGTSPAADGTMRWTIVWTAPMHGGSVRFHVAANAADGDGTAEGDYIYLASAASEPAVMRLDVSHE